MEKEFKALCARCPTCNTEARLKVEMVDLITYNNESAKCYHYFSWVKRRGAYYISFQSKDPYRLAEVKAELVEL